MASPAVVAAVEARLAVVLAQSLFAAVTLRPLNTMIEAPVVDGGLTVARFLEVQYPTGREEQISVGAPGANTFREEGTIRFVLEEPIGSGTTDGNARIEALRSVFRSAQFGGVTTFAPGPALFDDSNRDAACWAFAFAVPYRYDFRA